MLFLSINQLDTPTQLLMPTLVSTRQTKSNLDMIPKDVGSNIFLQA